MELREKIASITIGQMVLFVFAIPRMIGHLFSKIGAMLGVTVLEGVDYLDSLDSGIVSLLATRNKLCDELAEKGLVSRTRKNWILIRESTKGDTNG